MTAGTQLHGTKAALGVWEHLAARLEEAPAVSAQSQAIALSLRYETVWRIMHRIRAALPPVLLDPVRLSASKSMSATSVRVSLSGLPYRAMYLPFLHHVDVVAAVRDDAVHAPDWSSHVQFALPTVPGLWALVSAGRPVRRASAPVLPPGLTCASPDVGARLQHALRKLKRWVGAVHRQVSVRWFDGYARYFRDGVLKPATKGMLSAAVRCAGLPWRGFEPTKPQVTTSASACGRIVQRTPRRRRVSLAG